MYIMMSSRLDVDVKHRKDYVPVFERWQANKQTRKQNKKTKNKKQNTHTQTPPKKKLN